jgi:hypothetical protein
LAENIGIEPCPCRPPHASNVVDHQWSLLSVFYGTKKPLLSEQGFKKNDNYYIIVTQFLDTPLLPRSSVSNSTIYWTNYLSLMFSSLLNMRNFSFSTFLYANI